MSKQNSAHDDPSICAKSYNYRKAKNVNTSKIKINRKLRNLLSFNIFIGFGNEKEEVKRVRIYTFIW